MSSSGTGGAVDVLHVEDDTGFADLVGRYLGEIDPGLSLHHEPGLDGALAHLRSTDVDCVVTDHDLGGADGLQIVDRVRDIDPAMPVILFTSRDSADVASEAIAAGATDYVQKGGRERYEILAHSIRRAVDRRRARAAYRAVFDGVGDGIIVHDADTYAVADANLRACSMLGYDRQELIGRGPDFFTADDQPYVERAEDDRITRAAAGETLSFRYVLVTADDECIVGQVTMTHARIDGEDRALATIRAEADRDHPAVREAVATARRRLAESGSIEGLDDAGSPTDNGESPARD
ncbi:hypothetical protein BRD17_03340 [Halobacteriales archaeon SW_7_68_16]|nr:MAG: hypothetical protein BRD17_03340 [Halobacteriales archaeon SW_7_68_16]